jgi:hypothetical protein
VLGHVILITSIFLRISNSRVGPPPVKS